MRADSTLAPAHRQTGLSGLCVAIAEHSPLPMAAVEGPGHIVRYVNAAFCHLVGKPIEQLTGKPFAEIVPADDGCLVSLDRVYGTGKAESYTGPSPPKARAGFWSFTMWPVLLAGHPLAVMLQVTETTQLRTQTVAMNEALTIGMVRQHEQTEAAESLNARLHQEMAVRSQAEQALRQSEERFRALFDWGPIAMYSCDRAGVIQAFNRGAVKLWQRQPKPGDTDAQFRGSFRTYMPDGTPLPHINTLMARVLKGESAGSHDSELVAERPDGSRLTLVVNVVPLFDAQGKVNGTITCFYDITERSLLKQQALVQAQALADLDRRKDEFLAMLSHELRNPLAALSNAAHLLRLQKDQTPIQRQAGATIERQVGQLKNLVDDLLEVSRISTGRVQLRREPVAVSGIVERAVETAQPLITQHRHELTVAMPPEPVWLHADAARLEQVLVNLLTNAAKYTGDGGRIGLSVKQEVDILVPVAVITVRDSGIGIESDLLPHIFDLFTQAERSLDRSEGGLGIGLSLVQRLVELHGGTVTASSVPGQGSEFAVRLPLMVRPVADLPLVTSAALSASSGLSELSESSAPPAGSGCRVLLVDDNADSAQTLALLLEMSGHVVQLAYDGLSAVEAAIQFRPDVALLDIGLPGLDGYQTAQRIRRRAELEGVVLIALTGYGRDTDRERSKQAGFDHHLVKPASIEEIEAILRGVAAAR